MRYAGTLIHAALHRNVASRITDEIRQAKRRMIRMAFNHSAVEKPHSELCQLRRRTELERASEKRGPSDADC